MGKTYDDMLDLLLQLYAHLAQPLDTLQNKQAQQLNAILKQMLHKLPRNSNGSCTHSALELRHRYSMVLTSMVVGKQAQGGD